MLISSSCVFGVERHALVQIARQPRPNLVLAVHREHVADQRAAARAERQPRQLHVLREIVGDAEVVDVRRAEAACRRRAD